MGLKVGGMTNRHHTSSIRRRMVLAFPAAIVAAAFFGSPAVAATPVAGASPTVAPAPISPGTQGIIMSDGRICNPRWGG
jgi:hypothetical protein